MRTVLGLILGVSALAARGQTFPFWDYAPPSLPKLAPAKLEYQGTCYELTSGKFNPLDCHMVLEIYYQCAGIPEQEVLRFSGGHKHPSPCGAEPDRPVGTIQCTVGTPSSDGRLVEGQSLGNIFDITYTAPEVSGTVTLYIEYIFPKRQWATRPIQENGWTWQKLPDGRWMARTWAGLVVGIGELQALPALTELYVRCGLAEGCKADNPGADVLHPSVHNGSAAIEACIQTLASYYRALYPDRKLRILDMSLPTGGLLDGGHEWKRDPDKGHKFHRIGNSVDLGSWAVNDDGSGVYPSFRDLVNDLEDQVTYNQMPLKRYEEGENKIHFQLKGGQVQ